MGCNRNRLAGSLTAGPLDKKKDEETLFNKAARPCQATISPLGLPEMREQRGREQRPAGRYGEVWGGKRERAKRVIAWRKKAMRIWEMWRGAWGRLEEREEKSKTGQRRNYNLDSVWPFSLKPASCCGRNLWQIRSHWFHFTSINDNWGEGFGCVHQ